MGRGEYRRDGCGTFRTASRLAKGLSVFNLTWRWYLHEVYRVHLAERPPGASAPLSVVVAP